MAHLSDRQKAELVRQHQDGVPWTRLAEHSGVAVRTLQRWAARIETGQLARVPRRDKGSTRIAAELVTAIKAAQNSRDAIASLWMGHGWPWFRWSVIDSRDGTVVRELW